MAGPPGASKKLAQARFFLGLAHTGNKKVIGTDAFAIEAYLSALLSMAQAAFYRLEAEIDPVYLAWVRAEWWDALAAADRKILTTLIGLRHQDVHRADPDLAVKESAIPAHWASTSVSISSIVGVFTPNPVPGGSPPFAPAWIVTQEVHLAAADPAECARALDLLDDLIARFPDPTGMPCPAAGSL